MRGHPRPGLRRPAPCRCPRGVQVSGRCLAPPCRRERSPASLGRSVRSLSPPPAPALLAAGAGRTGDSHRGRRNARATRTSPARRGWWRWCPSDRDRSWRSMPRDWPGCGTSPTGNSSESPPPGTRVVVGPAGLEPPRSADGGCSIAAPLAVTADGMLLTAEGQALRLCDPTGRRARRATFRSSVPTAPPPSPPRPTARRSSAPLPRATWSWCASTARRARGSTPTTPASWRWQVTADLHMLTAGAGRGGEGLRRSRRPVRPGRAPRPEPGLRAPSRSARPPSPPTEPWC